LSIPTGARREVKYLVSADAEASFRGILEQNMRYDIHCRAAQSYFVKSLYFDTTAFDAYHSSKEKHSFQSKLRWRQYEGEEGLASFIELKMKNRPWSFKERFAISRNHLEQLLSIGFSRFDSDRFFTRDWSQKLKSIWNGNLQVPRLWISYRRMAFVGDRELRLTLDRDLWERVMTFFILLFLQRLDLDGLVTLLPVARAELVRLQSV